jgi:hypothetical protein
MRSSIQFVVSFPDDAIFIYQHGANHGIRRNETSTPGSQLQTALHVLFLYHLPGKIKDRKIN